MSVPELVYFDEEDPEPPLLHLKLGHIMSEIVLEEHASRATVEGIIGTVEELMLPSEAEERETRLFNERKKLVSDMGEIALGWSGFFGDPESNPLAYTYFLDNKDPEVISIDVDDGKNPVEYYAVIRNGDIGHHLIKRHHADPFDDTEHSIEKTHTILDDTAALGLLGMLRTLQK